MSVAEVQKRTGPGKRSRATKEKPDSTSAAINAERTNGGKYSRWKGENLK